MTVFRYDKTFEGLLTAVFDAYSRRMWPDALLSDGEPAPLFTTEDHTVVTDPAKSDRVWRGLGKKLPRDVCNMLMMGWLSEEPGVDMMLARYMRRVFNEHDRVHTDFSDPDILRIRQLAQKVSREREHLMQFTRFQKGADGRSSDGSGGSGVSGDLGGDLGGRSSDGSGGLGDSGGGSGGLGDFGGDLGGSGDFGASGGAHDPRNPTGQPTYFAPVSPRYNALPLAIPYFRDRFRDQRWLIYDIKRHYGYYYDLETVTEITMEDDAHLSSGALDPAMLAENEDLFQALWKKYIDSMAIKERINPRLQRQHMPRRFWPLMTEMQ